MKKGVFVALCCMFIITGCESLDTHVSLMHKTSGQNEFRGHNPAAMVEVRYEFYDQNYACSFWHLSNLTEGKPFNDREESSLDMVGCSLRLF